ncbi:DNA pilot protein [Peromfec virus RodF8_19]|uniref:DNA pilot protein n=1 Tax=Peromfec virus RodF8_19 TaxID=2929361 RepID=A0A976N2K7_9VIRU|nr:DNA pilot protein [Peromfec virus RodF8_19]
MEFKGSDLITGGTAAAGSILGMITAKQQFNRQKKLMELQHQYNEESANNAQQRSKEMWDYTNYENQRKHMEAAGLSVGLMYGQGGGGGVSDSGAQGQGVGLPTDTSGSYTMEGAAMGLQLAGQQAQIKLAEAQAEKAKAEAQKIAGADTRYTNALTNFYEAMEDKTWAEADNAREQKYVIMAQKNNLIEATRLLATQADVAEETKIADIGKSWAALRSMNMDILLKHSKIKLNEKQAEHFEALINRYTTQNAVDWYNAKSGRMTAEANKRNAASKAQEADAYEWQIQDMSWKIAEELGIKKDQLSVQQQKLWVDGILGILHEGREIAEIVLDARMGGMKKGTKQFTEMVKEIYNAKGQRTGTVRESRETINEDIQ